MAQAQLGMQACHSFYVVAGSVGGDTMFGKRARGVRSRKSTCARKAEKHTSTRLHTSLHDRKHSCPTRVHVLPTPCGGRDRPLSLVASKTLMSVWTLDQSKDCWDVCQVKQILQDFWLESGGRLGKRVRAILVPINHKLWWLAWQAIFPC
jgi:hypothetical protein